MYYLLNIPYIFLMPVSVNAVSPNCYHFSSENVCFTIIISLYIIQDPVQMSPTIYRITYSFLTSHTSNYFYDWHFHSTLAQTKSTFLWQYNSFFNFSTPLICAWHMVGVQMLTKLNEHLKYSKIFCQICWTKNEMVLVSESKFHKTYKML